MQGAGFCEHQQAAVFAMGGVGFVVAALGGGVGRALVDGYFVFKEGSALFM